MTEDRGGAGEDESAPDWQEQLSEAEYRVLREAGTEPAGSSSLLHVDADGVFRCAGCDRRLFTTDAKFESGTGWPSFVEPADVDAVKTRPDHSHGLTRTEAVCAGCNGHLGHVFDDGPEPTGERYCINGVALEFDPAEG